MSSRISLNDWIIKLNTSFIYCDLETSDYIAIISCARIYKLIRLLQL